MNARLQRIPASFGIANAQPIANQRYGRLKIRATSILRAACSSSVRKKLVPAAVTALLSWATAGWAFSALVTLADTQAQAADWPQYRGPNHDGVSIEAIRTNWSEEPPRQVSKIALEPALSSFTISGGRAFTLARRRAGNGEQEFCVALNAGTGQELWATPVDIADYPNGGVGFDDGPRSTPSVDGNRVFVLSSVFEARRKPFVWTLRAKPRHVSN